MPLDFDSKRINGQVNLPASKSISNRALLIHALANGEWSIENLSDCDDTNTLFRALHSDSHCFDVGQAGTAMRFLTAFLARTSGEWEITGSERMKQRPIGILVEALKHLGAKIEYLEKDGFPPLRISGSLLMGGTLEMPASVSSQYISALMMIAPYMEKGLTLQLTGKIVSGSYIDMTLRIMRHFGAEVTREGASVRVAPIPYKPVPFRVEADWSAASYFYELLAIADHGEIRLSGLQSDSVQGDARQIEVWERLGITTRFAGNEAILTKSRQPQISYLEYDFVEMPDLVQSFAVACCLNDIPFRFSGVETLRIKETDRITALTTELTKLGYLLETDEDNQLLWEGAKNPPNTHPEIHTYHDHRMAMAFAPATLKYPDLVIRNKEVVTKSFPGYWEELNRLTGC
ncbi:MAG: 3-phosphoshikimate 1-carboxyvinyltransferase [Odoribacter sp.]|nr:3-phosphoshikimate 1-carboxyvinyltransferase [Odoribacter sp.]